MTYWRFITYNIVGGIGWVAICLFAGYLFGNIPIVKENFSIVILAIVFISVLPGVIEFGRHRIRFRKAAAEGAPALKRPVDEQPDRILD
jgi:membrane-associated protein